MGYDPQKSEFLGWEPDPEVPFLLWRRSKPGARAIAYADLRAYGQGQPSLRTDDREEARALVNKRVARQEKALDFNESYGFTPVTLKQACFAYLKEMWATVDERGEDDLKQKEGRLEKACEFFGHSTPLHKIRERDVASWVQHMRERIIDSTIKKYRSALSEVFKWASRNDRVPEKYNPTVDNEHFELGERESRKDALEFEEAGNVLWVAKHLPQLVRMERRSQGLDGRDVENAVTNIPSYIFELVACGLFTGGRRGEVYSRKRGHIRWQEDLLGRTNHRFEMEATKTLKKEGKRSVHIPPQFEQILKKFDSLDPEDYLFPSDSKSGHIESANKTYDLIAHFCRLPAEKVRSGVFRITFCSTRLQCEGITQAKVSQEMGHAAEKTVKDWYERQSELRGTLPELFYLIVPPKWLLKKYPPSILEDWMLGPDPEATRERLKRRIEPS